MNKDISLEKFDTELLGRDPIGASVAPKSLISPSPNTGSAKAGGPIICKGMERFWAAFRKTFDECGADCGKSRRRILGDNHLEGCKPRRSGERIPVERATYVNRPAVHGAIGNRQLQYIATPSNSSKRQSAADHLAKRAKVRRDTEHLLCSAKAIRTGHNLVEDQ